MQAQQRRGRVGREAVKAVGIRVYSPHVRRGTAAVAATAVAALAATALNADAGTAAMLVSLLQKGRYTEMREMQNMFF